MVIASMSSRIEAFAQLLTLLIIFIFVLAVTYYVTRFVVTIRRISCLAAISTYWKLCV